VFFIARANQKIRILALGGASRRLRYIAVQNRKISVGVAYRVFLRRRDFFACCLGGFTQVESRRVHVSSPMCAHIEPCVVDSTRGTSDSPTPDPGPMRKLSGLVPYHHHRRPCIRSSREQADHRGDVCRVCAYARHSSASRAVHP
jgi:hypothetical protein